MRPVAVIVKPAQLGPSHAGDEIVNKRAIAALAETFQIHLVEVQPNNPMGRILALAQGLPPEVTRFASPANRERVRDAVRDLKPDVVCFLNEVTFPSADMRHAKAQVFYAHNAHSLIAKTEKGLVGRVFQQAAHHFERRWYGAGAGSLVCISVADANHLETIGVHKGDVAIAPPGPPPPSALAADAGLKAELVVTGSYGWWRKRRDLKLFAAEAGAEPVWVSDPLASEIVPNATAVTPDSPDWSDGVRFGVITDRFVGGFKLKSLEYVARNCVVVSYADIFADFAELPHAAEFVRIIRDRSEISEVVRGMQADAEGSLERFRVFKAACLERYDWARTMAPLTATAKSLAGLGIDLA